MNGPEAGYRSDARRGLNPSLTFIHESGNGSAGNGRVR